MGLVHGTAALGRAHIQLFASDESAPIRWRLLSGNNRELGRGTGEFSDRENCLLGIKHLQNVAADLEPSVQRCANGLFTWSVSLVGVSVAKAGRGYDRMIRCRQGLSHFAATFETAQVGPVVMWSQSRRWVNSVRVVGADSRGPA